MRSALFDKRNAEIQSTERWTLQSGKMLRARVTPHAPVVAAKGSMVAYQGNVKFSYESSGSLGKFLKKQFSGEDSQFVRATGQGEVFFARGAADIFLMEFEGGHDSLTVNSSSLLAYDPSISTDIKRLRGAGAMLSESGFFNVELKGEGMVALCSHGQPLVLDCSQQPTFVDPQAAVCWSTNLAPGIHTDVNLGTLLGRSSGETVQMVFHGPGFVVVQPYESTPLHLQG